MHSPHIEPHDTHALDQLEDRSVMVCAACALAYSSGPGGMDHDAVPLSKLGALDTLSLTGDPHFSLSPCDLCDTALSGDRWDGTVTYCAACATSR